MASGRSHDRAICWLCVPFGLLWWPWLGLAGVVSGCGGFLVGGLWLSPDLDTVSRPLRRWGPLAVIWQPYRRCMRHRSIASHGPLLGTGLRLAYLAVWLLTFSLLLQPFGVPSPRALAVGLQTLWSANSGLLLAALAGLEASSWLHLLQDGDPDARLPRRWRRCRRRSSGDRARSVRR
ncbi:metal-binding protein [Synechococcus sp. ATX 2A4]|uniref:metal-binding protein n=1 Tax=Synechococcus sp. ATX 2A4 TaxID=2823727 RepID=UPI0020CCFF2B|nr:metal-binding protein [Synechococcus sp. ATX 2A4]MCP9885524.1 metal-binding protein [Synechococcus sp. ATX 2A4]